MGTDIDLYVERRERGEWSLIFPPEDVLERLHGEHLPPSDLPGRAWYSGRNHELFALLADVRNYSGIESPWAHRGLPAGFSLDRELAHGHSHSWATLAELQAYPWQEAEQKREGFMDPLEYRDFRDTGDWTGYSRGVSGPNTVIVSPEEMDDLLASGRFAEGRERLSQTRYFVHVTWREPVKKSCRNFVERTLPVLSEVTAGTLPEDVRLVYWFDC